MKLSDFEVDWGYFDDDIDDYDPHTFELKGSAHKIYKVLKANFGLCQYIGNELENEGFTYWLKSRKTGYSYGFTYQTEPVTYTKWDRYYAAVTLYAFGKKNERGPALVEGQQLLQLIEKEARKIAPADEAETSLYLFQNPFHLYEAQARALAEGYKAVPITNWHNQQTYLAAPFFLLMAAFEGLLNLIYELYLDPSLRSDKRIKDQLFRSPIDLKLRLAPLYCTCFKARALPTDGPFRRFQAVVNLRNDLIHGNLTPTMRVREFVEDNIVFWVSDGTLMNQYHLPNNAQDLNMQHLDFVFETVEQMVESILSAMNGQHKYAMSQILHSSHFRARLDDGEFVIEADKFT
jgi:hypothetical protein